MKLFTRYTRINLLATVIVFLLSGIAFYFVLRFVLIDQVDEDLKIDSTKLKATSPNTGSCLKLFQ